MKTQKLSKTWDFDVEVGRLATLKEALPKKTATQLIDEFVDADAGLSNIQIDLNSFRQRSVLEVLRAGYALMALRQKTPHGDWEKLIERKLPKLSKTTRHRYIRVAEVFPDPKKVPANLTLTALYRQLELTRKPATPTKKEVWATEPTNAPNFTEFMASIRMAIGDFGNSQYIDTLSHDERQRRADAVTELLARLQDVQKELLKNRPPPLPPEFLTPTRSVKIYATPVAIQLQTSQMPPHQTASPLPLISNAPHCAPPSPLSIPATHSNWPQPPPPPN